MSNFGHLYSMVVKQQCFFILMLVLIFAQFTNSELQANNDEQACLQGSSEEADSCGTSRPVESTSNTPHAAASSSSTSHRKGQPAEAEWSEPEPAVGRDCSGSCRRLPPPCLSCRFNSSCVYGSNETVRCRPADGVSCTGKNDSFDRVMVCAYCYQSPSEQHDCSMCDASVAHKTPGRKYYRANCTVYESMLCMGNRTFYKSLVCKWTKGDRWSTALTLSIILGGFGVDRFYLGHWQEAIGKFFSFGGLGVWTLIDVVLIAIGYLSPADGSLYIT